MRAGPGPRVLVLSQDVGFPEGNAASLRARLVSRALVEAGASVRVFCTRWTNIPPEIENTQVTGIYEGIEFRYTNRCTTRPSSFLKRRLVDTGGLLSTLGAIARMRRAGEIDAVYFYSPHRWRPLSQIYLSFLNILKIPVALELNEIPWTQTPDRRLVERAVSPLHGVQGVIAISGYLEAWVDSEAERLKRDVKVLRLPILVDADEMGAASETTREGPFIVFACPAGRSRLFSLVAEAMQQVWEAGLKCDLVIVGPSRSHEENKWLTGIEGSSSYGSITWLGRVPRSDLLRLYREARALLLPLELELNSEARFPTKLGEYLASGTPVVATSLGELPSFLRDGETAYLVPPGSASIFGRRIADLLRDPDAAREVGRKGRELALSEFDYRQHRETLRDWFASLAARKRMP